jgi:tetratricopeptide (TPR) repeat protein
MGRVRAWLLTGALCLLSATAVAQARDSAAAEALFSEGRRAFDAGDYVTACDKFEESQRLDPAAGTLINLAACEERLGRIASAWQSWREALRTLRRDDDRYPVVERRAKEMEARVPRLEVRLAADTPPGTRVQRDDIELGAASLGVMLPVDPGKHRVQVTAPGFSAREYSVHLEPGENAGLVVEPGNPISVAKMPPHAAAAKPGATAAKPRAEPARPFATRTLGFVVGGAGLGAIAAGSVMGLLALDRKHTLEENCDDVAGKLECDEQGLDAASSGETFATLSTIAFAAGIVGLGAAAYLVLNADSGEPKTSAGARVAASGATLFFATRF